MSTPQYKIGDVSQILGISPETIRFFEEQGLVQPHRDEANNYRYYGSLDVNKIVAYRFFRSMEFSLEQSLEILSSPYSETLTHLDRKVKDITERLEFYQNLSARVKEFRDSLQRIDTLVDNYLVEERPNLLFYHNQVTDKFLTHEMKMTHDWLENLPFVWLALYIPIEEIPFGNRIHWGYAVDTKYRWIIDTIDPQLAKSVPKQKCVCTVLRHRGQKRVTPAALKPALAFIQERGWKLAGDVSGWILNEEIQAGEVIRNFLVWLPISEL